MITLHKGMRWFLLVSFSRVAGRIYGPRKWEWVLRRATFYHPDEKKHYWDFRLATPLFFAVLWEPRRR